MKVNLKIIEGNWDKGYALDKHTVSSTFIGYDEYNHPRFDTLRTEAGEALYQLKYQHDFSHAKTLAQAVYNDVLPLIGEFGLIVPVPPSKMRARQPVYEIGKELGLLTDRISFENLLIKAPPAPGATPIKDMATKEEKIEALKGRISLNEHVVSGDGPWSAILLDDRYDSGASMEAACAVLKTYSKVGKIYAIAMTW